MALAAGFPVIISVLVVVFGGGLLVGLLICQRRVARAARNGHYLSAREALSIRRHAEAIVDAVDD